MSPIILRIDKGSPDVWDLFTSPLYEERDTPRLLTETGSLESLGLLQDFRAGVVQVIILRNVRGLDNNKDETGELIGNMAETFL